MGHPPAKSDTGTPTIPETVRASTTRVKLSSQRRRITADGTVTPVSKVLVPAASEFSTLDTSMLSALNPSNSEYQTTKEQLTFRSSGIAEKINEEDGIVIDADLSQESARLQSLQIRQELRSQSFGIANQSPQVLVGLFRDS